MGLAAGGGSGAATGLAGEQFNRQLHQEELDFIKEKAGEYAAENGISVADAEQMLLRGALMNNDDDWKELLALYVSEGTAQYEEAFGWLASKASEANMIIRDSAGVLQPAFTSSAAEKANESLYATQMFDTPSNFKMYLESANIKSGEASVGELMLAYMKNPNAEAEAFLDGAGDALKSYAAFVDPDTYKSIISLAGKLVSDPVGTRLRILNGLKEYGVEVGADLMVDLLQMDLQDFRDDKARLSGGIAVEVLAELATMGTISAVTAAKYGLKGGKAVAKVASVSEDAARKVDEVLDATRAADDIAADVTRSKELSGSWGSNGIGEAGAANSLSLKISIKDHYNHHMDMVDDLKDQLSSQGYKVSQREVSFGSSCGVGRCRPDIVATAPDGTVRIIEVKTGDAGLSIRQSEIFPQIRDGDAIPVGKVAQEFGLRPGVPLKYQGYPDGIPVEEVRFPGVK